jgi:hypothetical protein
MASAHEIGLSNSKSWRINERSNVMRKALNVFYVVSIALCRRANVKVDTKFYWISTDVQSMRIPMLSV